MDDETLILIVRQYRELYDISDPSYSNSGRRNDIWEEIGEKMKVPGDDCRKRWNQIRDNYRKALKKTRTRSSRTPGKVFPIRFQKELEFIKPFIGGCGSDINGGEEPGTSGSQDGDSLPIEIKNEKRRRSTSTPDAADYVTYMLQKDEEQQRRNDALSVFFQSVEATVRTFPPMLQWEVKRSIERIVGDFEFRVLTQDNTVKLTE